MLLAAIDENHRGTYDFLYLPIDFKVIMFCKSLIVLYRFLFELKLMVVLFGCRINVMWVMPLSTWCLLRTLSPFMRFYFLSPVVKSH